MSEPLKPPTSYSDGVTCFEILSKADRDEELLAIAAKGTVPWTQGIAERFAKRLMNAISERLQKAISQFAKDLQRASGEEYAVVQAILSIRRQIRYLLQFVKLPVFPEEISKTFTEEIEKNAQNIQDQILQEVKKDPDGRLIRVVQHTPILVQEQAISNDAPIPMGKTKRRIIF
jgi:hypothetical protein